VSLQKNLKESKEVNQQLSRKIDNLQQVQKDYAQIVDDLFLVEAALPETVEFQSLALRINYLAFKNNLVLNSASFAGFDLVKGRENLEKGRPQTSYGFTLGLSGSFEQIKSFLTELEQIDRLIKINKVSFNAEKGKVGVAGMQIEIKGEAYWYSRESVLALPQPETSSEPILETDTELTL
jgi:Tfp pilus assembly protein PilO